MQNGDWIEMDGLTGKIRLIKEKVVLEIKPVKPNTARLAHS